MMLGQYIRDLATRSWRGVARRIGRKPPPLALPPRGRPTARPPVQTQRAPVAPGARTWTPRPAVPAPPAPIAPPPAPTPAPAPVADVPPPRTALLRRAAATDAFRRAGLLPPPRALWRFVDATDDVDVAITAFFQATGFPLARLSNARADRVLALLLQAEADGFGHALPGDRRRFAAMLRAHAGAVEARDAVTWAEDGEPLALANLHSVADRVSVAARARYAARIDALARALREQDRVRQDLLDAWRADWPDARHLLMGELLARADAVELRLETSARVSLAQLERDARVIESVNADLIALLDADTADDAPDHRALVAAFAAGASEAEVRHHWKRLHWQLNPEAPRLSADQRAARYRQAALADRTLSRLTRGGLAHLRR